MKIITDRGTGRLRGFAFIEMSDASAAKAAINKDTVSTPDLGSHG